MVLLLNILRTIYTAICILFEFLYKQILGSIAIIKRRLLAIFQSFLMIAYVCKFSIKRSARCVWWAAYSNKQTPIRSLSLSSKLQWNILPIYRRSPNAISHTPLVRSAHSVVTSGSCTIEDVRCYRVHSVPSRFRLVWT